MLLDRELAQQMLEFFESRRVGAENIILGLQDSLYEPIQPLSSVAGPVASKTPSVSSSPVIIKRALFNQALDIIDHVRGFLPTSLLLLKREPDDLVLDGTEIVDVAESSPSNAVSNIANIANSRPEASALASRAVPGAGHSHDSSNVNHVAMGGVRSGEQNDLAAENERLRLLVASLESSLQAELSGAKELRERHGAFDNETFPGFVDRIAAERSRYRDDLDLILDDWSDAYSAFKAAFDTPITRRRDQSEYAQDARNRLNEMAERIKAVSDRLENESIGLSHGAAAGKRRLDSSTKDGVGNASHQALLEELGHLRKQNASLMERLEIDPGHPIDGIHARDETINMLDSEVNRLRGSLQAEEASHAESLRLYRRARDRAETVTIEMRAAISELSMATDALRETARLLKAGKPVSTEWLDDRIAELSTSSPSLSPPASTSPSRDRSDPMDEGGDAGPDAPTATKPSTRRRRP